MEERPPIWRVAANTQSRTADKLWSSSLLFAQGVNKSFRKN